MKTDVVNLTPHAIMCAGVKYNPSGTVARVKTEFTPIEGGFCQQKFGEVQDLPEPKADTLLIVSAIVFAATDRSDVIAPATGHPDVERNEKGHIVSVPAFLTKTPVSV